MTVKRFAVSFEPKLAGAVRRAAGGGSISSWLADAAERKLRAAGLWAALKLAAHQQRDVMIPNTALAQVWRGTARQAQLAKALAFCVIAGFDALARAVGELCGRSRTNDLADAHVAIVAASRGDVVYTSDPVDVRRLLAECGSARPRLIRC